MRTTLRQSIPVIAALVVANLFFAHVTFAQGTMGRWETCGLSGTTSGSLSPTGVVANVTFSDLSRGDGISATSATDGYYSSGWSTSGTLTLGNNDYYEFTITPAAGYQISISTIKIRDQRSTNSSSFDAYLRFSDDSYAANVVASWLPSTTATNRALDVSGVAALQNRMTAVTFRVYGSDANNTADSYGFFCQGTSAGNYRGVDIDGTVSVVTSPFTFSGTGTFVVPAGVTCVQVQTWGGGGGGGMNDTGGGGGTVGAGGGGGGGYREGVLIVSPGDNISITVGAGGAGAPNTTNTAGTAGGSSSATHTSGTITANGGGAGTSGTGGGTGGSGSFSGTVYGQVANNGGNGGTADNDEGGGGGGAGGTTSAGGNGDNGSAVTHNGGAGADGRVVLTWGSLSSSTAGTITIGSPASSCTSPFNPSNISGDDPAGTETWSWQSSTDNGTTWATISGATSASYDPGNITTTTQYRRLRSVSGECPGISNVVTYSVNTPPTAGAPTTASACTGTPVTIAGNPSGGSGTYTTHAWTITNAGGTGATNGANLSNANQESVTFNGTGLSAGTVTLQYTVTDDNGCTGTKTVAVTVSLSPSTTGATICQGAASQNLSVNSACSDVSGSEGANFPLSGNNVSGIGTLAWTNAGNILTDNGSNANASVSGGSGTTTTQYLQGTNYGFSIPANATINGIQVSINRSSSTNNATNNVQDNSVRLIKGGAVAGNNKAAAGNWPTTTSTVVNYGGASDLWGTTWTPAEINASNFGAALSVNIARTSGTVTASVDYISITVSYTIDHTISWYTVSSGGTAVQTESTLTTFDPVGDAEVLAAGAPYSSLNNTNTPGTYTFYAECSLYPDCRKATNFVINAAPTAVISGNLSFCAGSNTTLTASGGTSYLWDGGSTSAMRTVSAAGTYTVQVTDANNCTDTEMVTVTESPTATADAGGPYEGCGTTPVSIEAVTNGSGSWSGGLGSFGSASSASTTYTPHASEVGGSVNLTWTTDDPDGAGPCASVNDNATLTIGIPATADAGGPYTTCGATPVAISATTSGSGMWSGGSGMYADATSPNTTYTPAMSEFGTTVTLAWTTNDPDGVAGCIAVSDMADLAVSGQEIEVEGEGMAIANGDVMPSVADDTDFGWTTVSAGTITRTFNIQNSGPSPLSLTGGTPVTITGPAMADFTVTMQPASPVAPNGGMTMFQVQFDPSAPGVRSATVNIANNDCDEAPFTFDIQGKGTIPQAISVFGNGNQIANRASGVSVSDNTDFGSAGTGGGMVSHSFTVENVAFASPLQLTGFPLVTIAGRDAADFTVTIQPSNVIEGGNSSTFTVTFQPSATGLRTALVVITHNDLPENAFVFAINGIGL